MNKFFVILIFTGLTNIAFGAPCGGALGTFHKNPDNGTGGFVANTASVSMKVYIDASSEVCEKARVEGNAQVRAGSFVGGQAVVDGNSVLTSAKVRGVARVSGNSVVTNSKVCQASEILFNVINSDYYCQTDDEEPNDPGELGKKTVIGIDSDVDGVRDDVEIWINNNTSNTPNKDMYNVRMALKQIAKNVQSNVKVKDNKQLSSQVGRQVLDNLQCLQDLVSAEDYEVMSGDLQVELYNTMDRLKTWAKLQGNLSGQTFTVQEKAKKSTCGFKLK